ncbi:hypothetical protein GCM10027405_12630 [Arthrobacter alkaliphilus]|uniref:hypothetical protein n=1 Tax=Arthrobacter alkaliphilus TaxID=369936 RepID=UPI001F3527A6|nr:hypothetical protein [Arthrobacter alkaliphilus]
MPKQYKVKGASLDAIRLKAEQQYGPGARIVSAEKVTSPGIAGLFAANRFEATVEVQVEAPARLTGETHALQGPAIAALLKQADAAEIDLHRPSESVSAAAVSTASPDFAGMLEQLGKEIQAPGSAVGHALPVPVPVPLAGSGDLVILLGLGDDALGPALEMSIAQGGSDVRTAGALTAFGHLHVAGRQGATAARAQAVLTGQSVLLAYGLGRRGEAADHADEIAALAGDQLWLVADAGRKADDTAAWVGALSAALSARNTPLDALAVFGASETASPETVNGLGLPVGWVDGKPARVAVLGKVD